jgi:hypothetical protein
MSYDFDYYDGTDFAYPQKPTKPKLTPKHDSVEALAYADALVDYEHEFESYKESLSWYNDSKATRLTLFKDMLRDDHDITQVQFNIIWHAVEASANLGGYMVSQAAVDQFDLLYDMAAEFAAIEKCIVRG